MHHLIRSESSDRGNQFVPDKFSLNDQRKRAAASAIKSRRARSLACSSIEKNERFVMSRTASSQRPRFRIKADDIAEALIFRPKVLFQLAPVTTDTAAAREDHLKLAQRRFPNWPNILIARIPIASIAASPNGSRSPWKKFLRLALPHPGRICDARVTMRGAGFRMQRRASIRSPGVARWL